MNEKAPSLSTVTPKRWYQSLWFRLTVGFVGVLLLLDSLGGGNGQLPTCESQNAENMVKGAIKNGPLSKVLNIEILALKDVETKSSSEDKVECVATGLTNAGDTKFKYTFTWVRKEKGEYYVDVREI